MGDRAAQDRRDRRRGDSRGLARSAVEQLLVESVHMVREQTPPELLGDFVADNGVVLTGGGASLRNLDVLLSREVGVSVKAR